jgi:aspartate-semialdehyde dehydrogenase
VHVEFTRAISAEEARQVLSVSPGVRVLDDTTVSLYPQPWAIAGTDECYVGRIRQDTSHKNGLAMWTVADNIRKGAALNAVQIAEEMIKREWLIPRG